MITIALELVLAGLHLWLNVGLDSLAFRGSAADARKDKLRVGFLPVT